MIDGISAVTLGNPSRPNEAPRAVWFYRSLSV